MEAENYLDQLAAIPAAIRKSSPLQDLDHPVWDDWVGAFVECDAQLRARIRRDIKQHSP